MFNLHFILFSILKLNDAGLILLEILNDFSVV